jgi:hypothetical protein
MIFRLAMAFILAFFIEVKIKAETTTKPLHSAPPSSSPSLVHFVPSHCALFTTGCQVGNLTNEVRKIEWSEGDSKRVVMLYPDTQILFESSDQFALVKGAVFVDYNTGLKVRSEFATVQGEYVLFMVTRTPKFMEVQAFENTVILVLRGQTEKVELKEGFKVQTDGINSKGRTVATFPEPLTPEGDLVPLALTGNSYFKEIQSRLTSLANRLPAMTEEDVNQKIAIIDSEVAAQKEEAQRRAAFQRAKAQEQRELLDFVRRKNYLEF